MSGEGSAHKVDADDSAKTGTSTTAHTPLTNTHKGNQHYSLEGKLHAAEEELNQVVHILHENEHMVEERAHKLEELKHRTEKIEHDAAILDSKVEKRSENH